jgi:hypothetical protein
MLYNLFGFYQKLGLLVEYKCNRLQKKVSNLGSILGHTHTFVSFLNENENTFNITSCDHRPNTSHLLGKIQIK